MSKAERNADPVSILVDFESMINDILNASVYTKDMKDSVTKKMQVITELIVTLKGIEEEDLPEDERKKAIEEKLNGFDLDSFGLELIDEIKDVKKRTINKAKNMAKEIGVGVKEQATALTDAITNNIGLLEESRKNLIKENKQLARKKLEISKLKSVKEADTISTYDLPEKKKEDIGSISIDDLYVKPEDEVGYIVFEKTDSDIVIKGGPEAEVENPEDPEIVIKEMSETNDGGVRKAVAENPEPAEEDLQEGIKNYETIQENMEKNDAILTGARKESLQKYKSMGFFGHFKRLWKENRAKEAEEKQGFFSMIKEAYRSAELEADDREVIAERLQTLDDRIEDNYEKMVEIKGKIEGLKKQLKEVEKQCLDYGESAMTKVKDEYEKSTDGNKEVTPEDLEDVVDRVGGEEDWKKVIKDAIKEIRRIRLEGKEKKLAEKYLRKQEKIERKKEGLDR